MTDKEQKIQRRTMNVIRKYGGYVVKNPQNMYTEKGRPDLTACIPVTIDKLREVFGDQATVGIYVSFEMKREGRLNGVSEAQEIVGEDIKKHGGLWFLIDDDKMAEALMIKLGRTTDNGIQ